MDNLFKRCSSLSSLPDLRKWNLKNISSSDEMIDDCFSLINISSFDMFNPNKDNSLSSKSSQDLKGQKSFENYFQYYDFLN